MDAIDRRSAGISLGFHLVVVVLALLGIGGGVERHVSLPPPAPTLAPEHLPDDGAPIIPLAQASAHRTVTLPALGAASAPVLIPLPDVRPGPTLSRGAAGKDPARLDLPASTTSATPLHDALRGLSQVPAAADLGEQLRRDSARHLDYVLRQTFLTRWRVWKTRVTQRHLVLWLVTDQTGRIAEGGLYHCTTGIEELDRAIQAWLVTEDVGLPPIPPGVTTYVRVDLP